MDVVRRPLRALVQDVEEAKRHDLVAPELHTERLGSPEREDVEEAATHRVLSHFLHQGNRLEAPLVEVLYQAMETRLPSRSQSDPELCQTCRDRGPLLQRAQGRHQQPCPAPQKGFHGFDPEPSDLQVWLARLVGEGLPLGKQEGLLSTEQGLQVRLRIGGRLWRRCDDHQHPGREALVQGCDQGRGCRADRATENATLPAVR